MPQGQIDSLLQIWAITMVNTSKNPLFCNARDLYDTIDVTEDGHIYHGNPSHYCTSQKKMRLLRKHHGNGNCLRFGFATLTRCCWDSYPTEILPRRWILLPRKYVIPKQKSGGFKISCQVNGFGDNQCVLLS